jgi:hypothetical protein
VLSNGTLVRNQLVSRKAIEAYSSERYLLWPGRGRGAQKSCAFRQALEEFPLTIEVMIVNKYFGLTPDNIRTRKCTRKDLHVHPWQRLEQWLLALPNPRKVTQGVTKVGIPHVLHC